MGEPTPPADKRTLPSPSDIASLDHRQDVWMPDVGMTRGELHGLFREWEEDYAARRLEDAQPKPRLASPSEIGKEQPPRPGIGHSHENGNSR